MQRFAKVPVHTAAILESAEAAILLERVRERTVGENGHGQHCRATAKWWNWSTPWISVRRTQEILKDLVDKGLIVRTQLFNPDGGKGDSLYAITVKGMELLSISTPADMVGPDVADMRDAEIDAYLEKIDGGVTLISAHPTHENRVTPPTKTAHLIESNIKDSKRDIGSVQKSSLSSPPTDRQWVDYCSEKFPDWMPAKIEEAWHYNESRGWTVGKSKMKNWHSIAATAYGKAKEWGHVMKTSHVSQTTSNLDIFGRNL